MSETLQEAAAEVAATEDAASSAAISAETAAASANVAAEAAENAIATAHSAAAVAETLSAQAVASMDARVVANETGLMECRILLTELNNRLSMHLEAPGIHLTPETVAAVSSSSTPEIVLLEEAATEQPEVATVEVTEAVGAVGVQEGLDRARRRKMRRI